MMTGKLCRQLLTRPIGPAELPGISCVNPFIDAVDLTSGVMENIDMSAKGLIFGGMHFQLDYVLPTLLIAEGISDAITSESSSGIISVLDIWSAIVRLPKAGPNPETNVGPAYLPVLSAPAFVLDEDADILWKRVEHFQIASIEGLKFLFGRNAPGTDVPGGSVIAPFQWSQQQFLQADRIKSVRRLVENQDALYLVTCIVDGLGVFDSQSFYPVVRNFWSRFAVRVARR